jgi:S1-C subfamily serine protease
MKNCSSLFAALVGALLVLVSQASAQTRSASSAKTPAQIPQENNPAFALILSDGSSTVSLGSGFFIEDGSALVTNFHVIEGAKVVYVKTGDGPTRMSSATTWGSPR